MQYTFDPKQGDANYRLRVACNNGNLVARNVAASYDAVAQEVTYTTTNYVQMFQEVSSTALWNPVASIIFASALLPIKTTQTSLPRNIGSNGDAFTNDGNNSNLISAISDFSINNRREQPASTNPTLSMAS